MLELNELPFLIIGFTFLLMFSLLITSLCMLVVFVIIRIQRKHFYRLYVGNIVMFGLLMWLSMHFALTKRIPYFVTIDLIQTGIHFMRDVWTMLIPVYLHTAVMVVYLLFIRNTHQSKNKK